eukprot:CAMPEP_0181373916 /NCGR_PEP_ID=MMETSP1106-20121128/15680_1 /TAXON_ID=81844 /ORGANISM="Mantoniella antarctica, Strain SL-175" /LENGTH=386 /DNA_ID=CAMNT_0023491739 /DNA_START=159 /DNA_END=1316 /DNA_ORIENTATION=+
MFGSKAEETYYKTMPAHELYAFEEMHMRGEYDSRPTVRAGTSSHAKAQDGAGAGAGARRKIIDESGWAATNTAAYRPLGTPDLDRRRRGLPLPLRRPGAGLVDEEDAGDELEGPGAVAGRRAHGRARIDGTGAGVSVGGGSGGSLPGKHEDRRLASDGLASLRAEVEDSQNRARFCRTGGSFMSLVTRQQTGGFYTGAAIAEVVSPKSRSKSRSRSRSTNTGPGGNRGNRHGNENGKGLSGAAAAGLKEGGDETSRHGRHSKVKQGSCNKHLATLDEEASASKPAAAASRGAGTGIGAGGGGLPSPHEFLSLDPAVTVKARSREFMASVESMDGRLMEAIGQLKSERPGQYRRKYASLRVEGPNGTVGTRGFNAEEWRLEAEKRRI